MSPANDPPSVNRRRALAALGLGVVAPGALAACFGGPGGQSRAKQAPPTPSLTFAPEDAAKDVLPTVPVSVTVKDGWFQRIALTNAEGTAVAGILNRDRTKMSKRSGEAAVAVGDWRRAGFVADALLSYLALLGFHPGDDREILTRTELLEAFTLDRLGRSGSVFDAAKLQWVNAHVLHHASGEQLDGWLRIGPGPGAEDQWQERVDAQTATLDPALRLRLLEAVRGNVATLAEVPGELGVLVGGPVTPEPEAEQALATNGAGALLNALAEALGGLAEWSGEGFKSALQSTGKAQGRKGRDLFMPVRAALTGRTHGPELPLLADLLGKTRCIERLQDAARRAS